MPKDLRLTAEDVERLINAAADDAVADAVSRPGFRAAVTMAISERLGQAFAQEARRQAFEGLKVFRESLVEEADTDDGTRRVEVAG